MVDFVVNCFERTYRDVLALGFVDDLVAQQARPVKPVILISNVTDAADARRRADKLAVRVEWVSDHLDRALRVTGLARWRLWPLLWYSAAPLVALTLAGDEWLVYWDADVRLIKPHDWITPSVDLLSSDPRLFVANPRWHLPGALDTLDAETLRRDGDFAIGHGFSDQVFLVNRADAARPIYRHRHPDPGRYPAGATRAVFEQRADAYMLAAERLRATYLPATYVHPVQNPNYPRAPWTRIRRKLLAA